MFCPPVKDAETDAKLLLRTREGDSAALGQLFQRYELPVFRLLMGMLKNREQAEDALQETFIQAIRKADQVQPESIRGWLFTVAHQQAVLLKRQAKRHPTLVGADLIGMMDRQRHQEDPFARSADTAAAVALLTELPAGQQAVIRMRFFDGLRFQEVAKRLGVPLGTALARMHDGLKKMRELWEERYA